MAHGLKQQKILERKSSIYIRQCARLPIHSLSQTQGKTTQSVNYTTLLYSFDDEVYPHSVNLFSEIKDLPEKLTGGVRLTALGL